MVYTEVYNIEDGLGTIQVSTALLLVACINHVKMGGDINKSDLMWSDVCIVLIYMF